MAKGSRQNLRDFTILEFLYRLDKEIEHIEEENKRIKEQQAKLKQKQRSHGR